MEKENLDTAKLVRLKECYIFAASFEPSERVRALLLEKERQLSGAVNDLQENPMCEVAE